MRRAMLVALVLLALAPAACQTAPAGSSGTTDGGAAALAGLPDTVPAYMVKGSESAKITMYEWSDYECPYCSRYAQETAPQIYKEYVDTGKVRLVFRDLPLPMHPFAARAAEAARCVGESGGSEAYWTMHDALFAGQESWSAMEDPAEEFQRLAGEAGVDATAYSACVESGRMAQAVEASLQEAQGIGIQATPTFILDDEETGKIEGAYPYETFKQSFDIVLAGGKLPTPTTEPTPEIVEVDAPRIEVDLGDAPVRGSADAPVTLVEFSDYQCPFCERFYSESNATLTQYVTEGKVRYAFKDFPLMSIHPLAAKAAEAAHCARDLGGDEAYWTMHDVLFGKQAEWTQGTETDATPKLAELATGAGLDGAAVRACLEAGTHTAKVTAGFDEALKLGLDSTPSLVINGQVVAGAIDGPTLAASLDRAAAGEPLKVPMLKQDAVATETARAATQ